MRTLLSLVVVTAMSTPLVAQQAVAPRPPQGAPPTLQQPSIPPPQGRQSAPPTPPAAQRPAPTLPAQGRQTPPTPTPPPPGVQAPRPGQQGQTPWPQPSAGASWQNIKLEVHITDSLIPDTPSRKAVTLLIADGRNGQVRGSGSVDGLINIDARPTLHRDGRIFLQLTMEYKPELPTQQTAGTPRVTTFSESLALMLEDGVQIVASESSDPRSDRKVTVALRATVQK